MEDEDQLVYRSGVGSVLFLLKHSRPGLSNCVHELSKVMDGANQAHNKALLRTIKYVDLTKYKKLVLESNEDAKWELKGFCDSDFAGDSDNRNSVSGFVVYFCGVPISWRSKAQRSVSLSSTEAKYMAISEVATEILFVNGILNFMGVPPKYPIQVLVGNIWAIYLSENATTSDHTKHIDTRYHFVRNYIEDGIIKVTFIKSEDNVADVFTKNFC